MDVASGSGASLTRTVFWRLVGVIILGALGVLLLTPLWSLPFGRASIVVQGPPGDRYTTQYTSEKPVNYENLAASIPHVEGWNRFNATSYIAQTEYLEPKGQALWVYTRGNATVQLMLVWSNKIGELHIPSVCYTYQGYKVLDERPHRVEALNTSKREIHFYVNELWTWNAEREETREVFYFFVKYGFGRGGRDAYFVRIECVNTPRKEAQIIDEEFARQVFLNIIDIYGVHSAPRGGTLLDYVLSKGYYATGVVIALLLAIVVIFFWLPGRILKEDERADRSGSSEPVAEGTKPGER